jgi:hypothetical protein
MYNLHVLAPPVFSENSVDQVANLMKRALVGLNVLAPQKKSFLRQGGEELESLRRVLVQASYRREQTWRESVQHRRNEEQSTEAEQLRSKPGKLQESTKQEHADFAKCKEDPGAVQGREGKDHSKP